LHQNDQGKPGFAKAYSFGLVTLAFFVFSWLGQFIAQVAVERNEARQHGGSFHWSEFWPQFFASTFENWQSEFLQLFAMVVLTAFLIHKSSSESRDGDEELKIAVLRIEERLIEMDERGAKK
jgi:hypothetical protein